MAGIPYTPEQEEFLRTHPDLTAAELEAAPIFAGKRKGHALQRHRERVMERARTDYEAAPSHDPLDDLILSRLQTRAHDIDELCNIVDRGPSTVQDAIERLRVAGYRVGVNHDRAEVIEPQLAGYSPIPLEHFRDGTWFRFGIVSDTHLCNKHARLDVLNAAYDHFAAEGIREVLHGGNWIDGEARFNRLDMVTPPGFERQIRYFLENYPQREGITTRFVDGDDHEGWYAQREGIEIGRRCVQTAHDMGRDDLEYLGYGEADIPFYSEQGGRPAILRLTHPKGGSSYALSYKPQKTIESYEGGEKPQIVLTGHYHKAGYFYWRNVHTLLVGCMERQTYFMRGKQLAAHVGFWTVDFQVHPDGSVPRFRQEWFPFFDEGYYANRYGVNDDPPTLLWGEDSAA